MTLRVAMWSGPRNISTAMMRAWSRRADTRVTDEPLYAHYLAQLDPAKRAAHPVADAVMRSQPTGWREVASALTGACDHPVWYQKHMTKHLTPEMDAAPDGWDWIGELANCFLIRDPAEMITSFMRVIDEPTHDDLGLRTQARLFDWVRERTGVTPPVLDAADVLTDPRRALSGLCRRLGLPFDGAMLAWEAGPHPEDGVWGPHWYGSLYESTGFGPHRPKKEPVPARLSELLEECRALYERLAAHRIV
jgi:hypothetical protein